MEKISEDVTLDETMKYWDGDKKRFNEQTTLRIDPDRGHSTVRKGGLRFLCVCAETKPNTRRSSPWREESTWAS